jgi:hypothetical protein
LFSFGLDSMGVVIGEATVVCFGSDFALPSTGYSFTEVYGPPMLGTSLGPAGNSDQSGSLGFYLKVEHQGSVDVVAITCHHVVAPGASLPRPNPSPFRLANSLGLTGKETPVRAQDPALTIQSPSEADHHSWTAGLEEAIQDLAAIQDFFAAMRGQECSEDGNENSLRLQTAQALSRDIGLVHISSGMTDVLQDGGRYGCRLDWALIELMGSRFAAGLEHLDNVSSSVARAAAQQY